MKANSFIFLRAVELAVLAAKDLVGSHDKNAIDYAAVDVINKLLKINNIRAKVAIGEGELDEAPMLYHEQTFSNHKIINYDIAVDPIEGTSPAALNEEGAISCLAIGKSNSMSQIPEMYMEKLFLHKKYHLQFNPHDKIEKILEKLVKIKPNLSCVILDKPRHQKIIAQMHQMNITPILIKEGDVLGAINVVLGQADILYGIGGAPEGILMASLAKATNHTMHNRLIPYDEIWPDSQETQKRLEIEKTGLKKHQFDYHRLLTENDLVSDPHPMFFAASLTGNKHIPAIQIVDNGYLISSFIGYNNTYHQISSKYPFFTNINELITKLS